MSHLLAKVERDLMNQAENEVNNILALTWLNLKNLGNEAARDFYIAGKEEMFKNAPEGFSSRAQKKVFDRLASQWLQQHGGVYYSE